MATFKIVWVANIAAVPDATAVKKGSRLVLASQMQRKTMALNRPRMSRQPTRPSSSPAAAKRKSVCRAGRAAGEVLCVWMPWR